MSEQDTAACRLKNMTERASCASSGARLEPLGFPSPSPRPNPCLCPAFQALHLVGLRRSLVRILSLPGTSEALHARETQPILHSRKTVTVGTFRSPDRRGRGLDGDDPAA